MFLRGMGFTFDDTDIKGVTSPLSEMERLISMNLANGQVIFPYIGGAEVNSSPIHSHHRYAINFGDRPLRRVVSSASWNDLKAQERRQRLRQGLVPLDYPGQVAEDWPDVLAVVEEKIKPTRESLTSSATDRAHRQQWWLYARTRPELSAAIADLGRVLVNSEVSQRLQFAFVSSTMVYSHTLNVFPLDTYAAFCALESRAHETWARFFGSSMKDDLRYTASDCFETFPFPEHWENRPDLESAGKVYYEHRAALMVENDEGMTKTYNRFHDIYEHDSRIVELRELHAAMDRAVLDAYGWTDISTDCDFILDYDIDEATWGRKKKPYRYRWPDSVRDEVLARLLALNAECAAAEARAGVAQPVLTTNPNCSNSGHRHAGRSTMVAESSAVYDDYR